MQDQFKESYLALKATISTAKRQQQQRGSDCAATAFYEKATAYLTDNPSISVSSSTAVLEGRIQQVQDLLRGSPSRTDDYRVRDLLNELRELDETIRIILHGQTAHGQKDLEALIYLDKQKKELEADRVTIHADITKLEDDRCKNQKAEQENRSEFATMREMVLQKIV